MDINGKWILLQDDEDFAPGQNRAVEISGQEIVRGKLVVEMSPNERLVMSKFDDEAGVMTGCYFCGADGLPDGDPAQLWRELEETADEDDPRWDELPQCSYARLIRDEGAVELPAADQRALQTELAQAEQFTQWGVALPATTPKPQASPGMQVFTNLVVSMYRDTDVWRRFISASDEERDLILLEMPEATVTYSEEPEGVMFPEDLEFEGPRGSGHP